MVNFRLIYKILGSLLFMLGTLMLGCGVMALCYKEDDLMSFLVSTLFTVSCGFVLRYFSRNANNSLSRRDAYFLVATTWAVFSLFGMLPFLIGGHIDNVTDAYFETISGFTTTGATIIDDVERLPHALLFWRSLTQWIGGLGIVFFTIAILPSMVGGSVKVFAAEATGPMRTKMHPRLSTSAKWIWSVYTVLTIACGVSYYAAGMGWFDCANYAMSTTATGGFSTHNDSTSFFHSATIDYVAILFQFLAGINFTLFYLALFKFRLRDLMRNSEFKLYISLIVMATLCIGWLLVTHNGYDIERALRAALFQTVSFITTTGLFNEDVSLWPQLTWMILALLTFIGACSGSTTGGLKCIRAIMLFKVLRNEFRRILHPNAVLPVKINGQPVSSSRLLTLLSFTTIFMLMLFLSTGIMILSGIDVINAIVIGLSCVSNVGPSLTTGIGPSMSWSELADPLKWLLSFLMLVGRLEIMTVLVLFTRAFWKDN